MKNQVCLKSRTGETGSRIGCALAPGKGLQWLLPKMLKNLNSLLFQRNKGVRGSPILGPGRENSKPFLPPSQNMSAGDDSALSSHFSGMSLGGSQGPSPMGGKFQTPVKVRNLAIISVHLSDL